VSVGGSVAFDYLAEPFKRMRLKSGGGRTCVPALTVARKAAACGRLPAMSLLTDLDAFLAEHGRCGGLEAGVDGPVVWMSRSCDATVAHRDPNTGGGDPGT
jgi:hypothetical protein